MYYFLRFRVLLAGFVTMIIFASCSGREKNPDAILIENVSVLNFETGSFASNQSVLIEAKHIKNIAPVEELANKNSDYKVIDGTGKFIIPGLIDMHVHVYNSGDLISYLNYGVTTVFNLRGSGYHLAWRDSVEAGVWLGPHILSAGPTTDSSPLTTSRNTSIDTPEEAGKVVKLYKEKGYHAIKIYNNYKPEVYRALIDSAEQEGIPVIGHIPRQMGIDGALRSGQKMIVHGEEFFHTYEREHKFYPDSTHTEEMARKIKESGTWIAPNLSAITFMIQAAKDMEEHLDNSERPYLSSNVYHNWLPVNNGYSNRDNPEEFISRNERMYDFVQSLTLEMNEMDVPLVTGTDVTVTGYPGQGLNNEIKEFEKAGLTKIDAIAAATLNPGNFIREFVNPSIKTGAVKQGYAADLIILDSNPLQHLDNLTSISGVIVSGQHFTRTQLEEEREEQRIRNDKLHQLVNQYEEIRAEEDFESLTELLSKTYKDYPKNPVFHRSSLLSDSFAAYNSGYQEQAFIILDILLKWFPEEYSLYYYSAFAYEDYGDTQKAREKYQQCLKVDPFAQMCQEGLDKLNIED